MAVVYDSLDENRDFGRIADSLELFREPIELIDSEAPFESGVSMGFWVVTLSFALVEPD